MKQRKKANQLLKADMAVLNAQLQNAAEDKLRLVESLSTAENIRYQKAEESGALKQNHLKSVSELQSELADCRENISDLHAQHEHEKGTLEKLHEDIFRVRSEIDAANTKASEAKSQVIELIMI